MPDDRKCIFGFGPDRKRSTPTYEEKINMMFDLHLLDIQHWRWHYTDNKKRDEMFCDASKECKDCECYMSSSQN